MLDLIPPDREVSIEREVFPKLVGNGLYGRRLEGYWIDIGTPERFLQANWDILEGRIEASARRADRRRGRDRRQRHGRRAGRDRLGQHDRRRGGDRGVGPPRRLPGRRAGAACARRSSAPGVEVAPGAAPEPGSVIGEGETGRGCRMTDVQPRPHERIRADDAEGLLDAVLAMPDHLRDALWRIESARLASMEAPGGLRLRHGRLGDRRRPRRGGARRPADEAAVHRPRLRAALLVARRDRRCSARATRATPRRPSPATRRPRRSGPSGWSPPPAASSPSWRGRTAFRSSACPRGCRRGRRSRYMFSVAAELAALALAAPRIHTEIDAAAAQLEERVRRDRGARRPSSPSRSATRSRSSTART